MYLKPSEIFFSQDSINNVFDKNCGHRYEPIGQTLDALCNGSISVRDIPTISVVKHDNKWFTADNRRLWVFRNLERLGKCSEINVTKGYSIPSSKFTTYNGGVDVIVRNGSPGGYWYRKPSVKQQPVSKPATVETPKIPTYIREDNKENVPTKSSNTDYTIYPTSGLKFRQFDNVAFNFRDEPKSLSTEIESRPTDAIVTVPKDEVISKKEDDYSSLSSAESEDISIHDVNLVPSVAEVVLEDFAIKEDSCKVQVDEDNNEVMNTDSRVVIDTRSIVSYPTNRTYNTVKKNDKRCIIAAIVSGVAIAIVVVVVIIVIMVSV
ncbi:uncharacterized protein LOC132712716 isoform X1 [Ruditapes philippinarum]|uniref:uncharacterized protein LOC132712716 isoform X1 n=1 Tax=Ruditapes philippinarum TaxID=129788 RepID=UPI00295AB8E0|nr:uncharacterized protein LOC132712716 isoform X1 [Ruditapes philippinarum]